MFLSGGFDLSGNIVSEKSENIHTVSAAAPKPVYCFFKRAADILLSLIASAVLLPVFLVISLLIKAEDNGPVLYAHTRAGLNGKSIKVYKFRSMKQGADRLEDFLTSEQIEEYKKEYKLSHDPRISKIGGFLRRTSLDELPQIPINILFLGNMSIVGPRPVMEEETLLYGDDRSLLLSAKPGLTGYWAAYSDKTTGYASGKRQEMELYYVKNRSVMLDIKIILKTVETVFRKAGDSQIDR